MSSMPWPLFLSICVVAACARGDRPQDDDRPARETVPGEQHVERPTMKLTSTAFTAGDAIPARYTCDGEDLAPALAWSGAPQATKSFALICDDPDAPSGTFVHWVAYDIPPATHGLADGITTAMPEGAGGTMGVNDFGANGYRGPCPPSGAHHYHFKLYALDMMLSLAPGVDKQRLEKLMHGHILAHAELVGVYARGQGGR